jgi:hypothetical protein
LEREFFWRTKRHLGAPSSIQSAEDTGTNRRAHKPLRLAAPTHDRRRFRRHRLSASGAPPKAFCRSSLEQKPTQRLNAPESYINCECLWPNATAATRCALLRNPTPPAVRLAPTPPTQAHRPGRRAVRCERRSLPTLVFPCRAEVSFKFLGF